jgi:hypothetical protein
MNFFLEGSIKIVNTFFCKGAGCFKNFHPTLFEEKNKSTVSARLFLNTYQF